MTTREIPYSRRHRRNRLSASQDFDSLQSEVDEETFCCIVCVDDTCTCSPTEKQGLRNDSIKRVKLSPVKTRPSSVPAYQYSGSRFSPLKATGNFIGSYCHASDLSSSDDSEDLSDEIDSILDSDVDTSDSYFEIDQKSDFSDFEFFLPHSSQLLSTTALLTQQTRALKSVETVEAKQAVVEPILAAPLAKPYYLTHINFYYVSETEESDESDYEDLSVSASRIEEFIQDNRIAEVSTDAVLKASEDRWQKIPIGAFRRTRRPSIQKIHYSEAVRPSSSHEIHSTLLPVCKPSASTLANQPNVHKKRKHNQNNSEESVASFLQYNISSIPNISGMESELLTTFWN